MISFKLKNRRRESRRKLKEKNTRRKYIRYAIFSVFFYVVFLVTTLPASVVVSLINDNPQLKRQIQLTSVTGSVWNANVSSSQIYGINFGQLEWDMHFLPLLLGEVKIHIKFNNKSTGSDNLSGYGYITLSLGGTIKVEDFTTQVSVDAISPLMYGLPARFAGDLNVHIDELIIEKGKRLNITSRVLVSKAGLVSPQQIEYGDILIKSSKKLTGSQIVLTDQGGPLILDGNISIKGNGQYTVRLGLGARNSASSDLRGGLQFLGRQDGTGKHIYKSNGKLSNW